MFENHEDMVSKLAKPGEDIVASLSRGNAHLWHMATGIAGEVGELIECVVERRAPEMFVKECGDIEFYFVGFQQGLGIEFRPRRPGKVNSWDSQSFYPRLMITATSLLDEVKKAAIYNKHLNDAKVTLLCNRLRRQLDTLYVQSHMTREMAIEVNMAKLSERYSAGSYSDDAAIARKDQE